MRKLIKYMANYISTTNNYNKDQREQIEYAMKTILFETLKLLGVVIIFSALGYPIQVLVSAVTTAIIRPFIGGYHEDKQIMCFITTLVISGSIVYLSVNVTIGLTGMVVLFIGCIFCIWNQAPIVNPKMPITRDDLLKRNRNIGTLFAVIFTSISLIFYKNTQLSNTIVWTIIYQTLLMFDKKHK